MQQRWRWFTPELLIHPREYQDPIITDRLPLLPGNQQRESTEGKRTQLTAT